MTVRILLIAAAIAWVAALTGLVWMMSVADIRLDDAMSMLIHLPFVEKTCAGLSCVAAAIGIVGAIKGARCRAWIGAAASSGWGVLGALYVEAGLRQGLLINMNPPIPWTVYSPYHAQTLFILMVGLTSAALCLGLLSRPRHHSG